MVHLQPKEIKWKEKKFINIINETKYSNYGSHLASLPYICVNIKFMDVNPTYIKLNTNPRWIQIPCHE